jgi:hypothetical protein
VLKIAQQALYRREEVQGLGVERVIAHNRCTSTSSMHKSAPRE